MALQDDDGTPTDEVRLDPEVEELWSSRALLLVLLLLIFSFWISYYLKTRRIKTVHETLVALFLGMIIGFIVSKTPGQVVQSMISFKNTIMLNVLLPPIILASGYDLKEENFFRNFGVILTFAFCGTFISAVVIGTLVYIWALLGLEGLSLGIIECLIFGSTLSATDPVTVLAIFNTLKVDPKLYSIIFGESLLNDAVAIVMFETLSQFHGEKIHILSFFHGVGIFLLVFLTSMALGVMFALGCSLLLKHSNVGRHSEIESCLVLLIAYTSYFFSNALTMSGIVSLLFCGITLKHYAYHNMSRRTQRTTKYMFSTLSSLAENFIFIYLGLSLFTQTQLVYKPLFIIVTGLAVCVARYCAVFPISNAINVFFRKARGARSDELPHSYQMMLFWAGLRGAVGVALAAGIKGHNAVALRTTVLVAVVMTMLVFGGTTSRMIEIVGIRTGVVDDGEDDSSDDDQGGLVMMRNGRQYQELGNGSKQTLGEVLDHRDSPSDSPYGHYSRSARQSAVDFHRTPSEVSLASQESDDEVLPSAAGPGGEGEAPRGSKVWRDGQWFTVLDENYLLPVFSNATASRKSASRKALRGNRRGNPADGSGGGGGGGLEFDLGSAAGAGSGPSSPWLVETGGPSSSSSDVPPVAGGAPTAHRLRASPPPPVNVSSSYHALPHPGLSSHPSPIPSFSSAISALVSNPLPSPSLPSGFVASRAPSLTTKKRDSDDGRPVAAAGPRPVPIPAHADDVFGGVGPAATYHDLGRTSTSSSTHHPPGSNSSRGGTSASGSVSAGVAGGASASSSVSFSDTPYSARPRFGSTVGASGAGGGTPTSSPTSERMRSGARGEDEV